MTENVAILCFLTDQPATSIFGKIKIERRGYTEKCKQFCNLISRLDTVYE